MQKKILSTVTLCAALSVAPALAAELSPEVRAKVDAKAAELRGWAADPVVVAAVRAANATPMAGAKEMTNEKWRKLTVLDPFVRSFSRNSLGVHLKGKQGPHIAECFVSAANGTKVAFLAKPTGWSHLDKDKHRVPMTGKTWVGPVEVDDSTGQQQVQVAVPVLDGGKPIGSLVVGLAVAKL
jgi:hypothetical protein